MWARRASWTPETHLGMPVDGAHGLPCRELASRRPSVHRGRALCAGLERRGHENRLLQWQAAVSEDCEREDAPGGHDDEAMRPSSTGSEQPAEEEAREHVRRARQGWVCAGVLARLQTDATTASATPDSRSGQLAL